MFEKSLRHHVSFDFNENLQKDAKTPQDDRVKISLKTFEPFYFNSQIIKKIEIFLKMERIGIFEKIGIVEANRWVVLKRCINIFGSQFKTTIIYRGIRFHIQSNGKA